MAPCSPFKTIKSEKYFHGGGGGSQEAHVTFIRKKTFIFQKEHVPLERTHLATILATMATRKNCEYSERRGSNKDTSASLGPFCEPDSQFLVLVMKLCR